MAGVLRKAWLMNACLEILIHENKKGTKHRGLAQVIAINSPVNDDTSIVISDGFHYIDALISSDNLHNFYSKWSQARPIEKLRGCIIKLGAYSIAMDVKERNYIFIIYSMDCLNTDNSFTFNEPKDVNVVIRENTAHHEASERAVRTETVLDSEEFYSQSSDLMLISENDKKLIDNVLEFASIYDNKTTADAVLSQSASEFGMTNYSKDEESALAFNNLFNNEVMFSLKEITHPINDHVTLSTTSSLQDKPSNFPATLNAPTLAMASSIQGIYTESMKQYLEPSQTIHEPFAKESSQPSRQSLKNDKTNNLAYGIGFNSVFTQDVSQMDHPFLDDDEIMNMLDDDNNHNNHNHHNNHNNHHNHHNHHNNHHNHNHNHHHNQLYKKNQYDKDYLAGSPEMFCDDEEDIYTDIDDFVNDFVQDNQICDKESRLQQETSTYDKISRGHCITKKDQSTWKSKEKNQSIGKKRQGETLLSNYQKISKPDFAYKSAKPRVDYVKWLKFL